MSNDGAKPGPEEAVTGPKTPVGFSGIRPWVSGIRIFPLVLLFGGAAWYLTHPLQLHSEATAGTMSGKVGYVDPGDVVGHPNASARPAPAPPHPTVTFAPVAKSDLDAAQPPSASAPAGATTADVAAAPPAAAYAPAATSPPTASPTQIAAQKRAEADRAALDAPLPASPSLPAPVRAKAAADYDVAPPSDVFLAPGTEIDVTLYTSIDSTVQSGQPGTIIGYVGRDVLDFNKRVVVVPSRSKIVGQMATTTLQPGQNRIGVIWSGIVLPNGHTIVLAGAPGIDLTGTSGFGAAIDKHARQELMNVIAFSILAAGAQLAQPQAANGCGSNSVGCSPSVGQAIGQAVGTQISNAATATYNRSSQAQPTAHVVEGAQVGVMLTNYMPMRAWDPAR